MNLPNKITLSRIFLIPLFMVFAIPLPKYFFINESINLFFENYGITIATFIFLLASVTDGIDGYIARKYKMVTNLGVFLDPIADKLIVNCALLLLASSHKISIIVPIIMISRDIIVDAIRLVASQKNIVLAASFLGKAKTMTQMIAICILLLNNVVFEYIGIPMDQIMIWLATGISVLSGIDYFIKNKQYIMESM